MESAKQLFDESKSLETQKAMISGYVQNGLTETDTSLFHEMQMLDIHPNSVTVNGILSACAQLGAPSLGNWIHDLIKRRILSLTSMCQPL